MLENFQKLPLSNLVSFPKLFQNYIDKNDNLKPFYGQFPDLTGFGNQIKMSAFGHRALLVKQLKSQYKNIEILPKNITLLSEENTYTVTTGHQLNIFTGPLYVIYKIVSTINLAKQLKLESPEKKFVPVYWMATEDHDFAEINNFFLFGKKHIWESQQTGAVGRMNPNELKSILNEIKEIPEFFEQAYLNQNTLADAVRMYMHHLFGEYGLVCVDGDDREFKALFKNTIKSDILDQKTEPFVSDTSKTLEAMGYKTQISARKVNFFYLDGSVRERIDYENGTFQINNTSTSFSQNEMAELIEKSPEKFSPNVVLRPLYQETILPNLAYLGGPSEVAYWLQLKSMFDAYDVTFPIVMPRNFALIVNAASQKRIEKLGVSVNDLFKEDFQLKRDFVEKNSENSLNLEDEIKNISLAFDNIASKTVAIDATLKATVESEKSKAISNIENLEKRIKKAEERNFETQISQLLNLKEKLFPNGGLQERSENFMNFYLNNPTFISALLETFDPLDFNFNVITV